MEEVKVNESRFENERILEEEVPTRVGSRKKDPNSFFTNMKGMRIFHIELIPKSQYMRAGVVFSHGYGGHHGRYLEFAKELNEIGIGFFAIDHQGFGRSDGERAHVGRFDDYVDEFTQYVEIMRVKYENLPLFLMGDSMGGLIVTLSALKNPVKFKGVILVSPMFKVQKRVVNPSKVMLAKPFTKISPKRKVTSSKVDQSLMTHSAGGKKEYASDPMNYQGDFRMGCGDQIITAGKSIKKKASSFKLPFYLAQSGEDHVADLTGAQCFVEASPSHDKKMQIYEGSFHDLLHESKEFNGEEARNDIKYWITQRII